MAKNFLLAVLTKVVLILEQRTKEAKLLRDLIADDPYFGDNENANTRR